MFSISPRKRKEHISRSDFSVDIPAVTWLLEKEDIGTCEFIEFATAFFSPSAVFILLFIFVLSLEPRIFQYIVFREYCEFLFGTWPTLQRNQPRYPRIVLSSSPQPYVCKSSSLYNPHITIERGSREKRCEQQTYQMLRWPTVLQRPRKTLLQFVNSKSYSSSSINDNFF